MQELSVVIVNYNTGALLARCIGSVVRAAPKAEAVLLDNASTDGSMAAIQNFQFSIFNFKTIRNKKNFGFARAVNQGIKRAKGEYILLLNPDAVVKPGAIQKMLEFTKRTEDCGAIAPRLLNPDGTVQASVMHFPTPWRAVAEFWFGVKNTYSKYVPSGGDPRQVEAAVMAALLITPAARKKVGLLDEKYFMYYEDLDYCKRLRKAGLKVYYLPSAEVIHYHGVSGRSLAAQENQWRRLIPSSKIYHGVLMHRLINFVIWSGQKWQKLLQR